MKVLHIIGGDLRYGASKGALILHNALLKSGVESFILNDTPSNITDYRNVSYINKNLWMSLLNKIYINIEKIFKTLVLHTPRETFTFGLFGFDITKLREYKNADIIHLHWLNQGFVKLGSLSKVDKPLVWTIILWNRAKS